MNIWLDESLVREPFVALLHGNFDWVFNRTDIERRERDETQHLSLVKSAAFDMLEQSLDDLKKSAVQELSRYYSDFEKRMVSGIRVTKEPRATFIPRPGMEAIRPGSDSGTEGVYLAGAWTDTGWPSTMESAVRSGNRVASKILSAEASAKEEHTG